MGRKKPCRGWRVEAKKGTCEPAVLSFWSPAIVIIIIIIIVITIIIIIIIILDGKSFLDDEMKLPCRWVDMTVIPDWCPGKSKLSTKRLSIHIFGLDSENGEDKKGYCMFAQAFVQESWVYLSVDWSIVQFPQSLKYAFESGTWSPTLVLIPQTDILNEILYLNIQFVSSSTLESLESVAVSLFPRVLS